MTREDLVYRMNLAQKDWLIAKLELDLYDARHNLDLALEQHRIMHELSELHPDPDEVAESPDDEGDDLAPDAPAPPRNGKGGARYKLSPEKEQEIIEAIKAFPDATYMELKDMLHTSTGTIARYRARLGISSPSRGRNQFTHKQAPPPIPTLADRIGLPPYRVERGVVEMIGGAE